MRLLLLAPISLVTAWAEASFVDNFDGNQLGSHWDLFSEYSNNWDATVSDGYLHVNGFYPNDWNQMRMDAWFPAIGQSDFIASMALVIDSYCPRNFTWAVMQQGGFSLKTRPTYQQFYAYDSDGNQTFLPPLTPGRHVFTISRVSSTTSLFVDHVLVSTAQNTIDWTQSTSLSFAGPYTGWTPMHIDYVYVAVPEPNMGIFCSTALLLYWRKKKHGKRMGHTHIFQRIYRDSNGIAAERQSADVGSAS